MFSTAPILYMSLMAFLPPSALCLVLKVSARKPDWASSSGALWNRYNKLQMIRSDGMKWIISASGMVCEPVCCISQTHAPALQSAAKNPDHTQQGTWKYSSQDNRKLFLVNFERSWWPARCMWHRERERKTPSTMTLLPHKGAVNHAKGFFITGPLQKRRQMLGVRERI